MPPAVSIRGGRGMRSTVRCAGSCVDGAARTGAVPRQTRHEFTAKQPRPNGRGHGGRGRYGRVTVPGTGGGSVRPETRLRRVKKRLDVLLVERGLAESRAQAQALVMAGRVRGYAKPGTQVDDAAELDVERPPPYVSRGGEKLAHGLDETGVDPTGAHALDVGASTGGFTDVLLQRGAAHVIALDVGYGQLHQRLRDDPRVTVLERRNARELAPQELPYAPDLVVCAASFISLRPARPPAFKAAACGWQSLVLVKPQFE